MSLDTLANVKLRLGVTTSADDSLLSALMDSADEWVAQYCGRDFAGGTFTEHHPAGGAPRTSPGCWGRTAHRCCHHFPRSRALLGNGVLRSSASRRDSDP